MTALMEEFHIGSKLQVVYQQDPSLHFCAVHMMVGQGQYHEKNHEKGIAQLISRVIWRGSKNMTETEIEMCMHQYHIHLEPFVSNHSLGVDSLMPAQFLDQGLHLLKNIFFTPTFEDQKITQEVKIIKDEINKVKEDPDHFLFHTFFKEMFDPHPYGRSVLGESSSLDLMNQNKLHDWYASALSCNPILIHVVGPYPLKDIQNKLNQTFKFVDHDVKSIRSAHDTLHPLVKKRSALSLQTSFQKNYHMMGFYAPCATDPDRYALEWIQSFWFNHSGGVLFERIREEQGLVYHIDVSSAYLKDGGYFAIYFNTSEKNVEKINEIIWQEINKLKQNKLSDHNYEKLKMYIQGSWILEWDCPLEHVHFFDHAKLNGQSPSLDKEFQNLLRVNQDDIQAAAQKYFQDPLIKVTLQGV